MTKHNNGKNSDYTKTKLGKEQRQKQEAEQ